MPGIAVLPDALINQIAAGEVVERPASVVKELGRTRSTRGRARSRSRIEGGGTRLIEVTDDGYGMSRDDAVLSVSPPRHQQAAERGGPPRHPHPWVPGRGAPGHRARCPGLSCGPRCTGRRWAPRSASRADSPGWSTAAARPGTRHRVEDLFFNMPARRKFLRRAETELSTSEEAVLRLALAHPEVGFFASSTRAHAVLPRGRRTTRTSASPPRSGPRCTRTCSRSRSGGWACACTESSPSPEFTFHRARPLHLRQPPLHARPRR